MELKYIVKQGSHNKTIDDVLLNEFHISTRLRTKLIKNNLIYKNGINADTRIFVMPDDEIVISFAFDEDNSNIVPINMNLNIIYEDDWFIVVSKPSGIAIHPSQLHYSNSLSNGIKFYFDTINLKKKIRPVNRLDLDTSGLVIFAKCEYIHECFIKQMLDNTFKKDYLCIVSGILDEKQGLINLPIARKNGSIIERCVSTNGQPAITIYEVLQEFDDYSLVHCELKTGRTHQIRVHMSAISHPIIGDTLYGCNSSLIPRQALHSYKITCIHPITKKLLTFVAPLPNDMDEIVAKHTHY